MSKDTGCQLEDSEHLLERCLWDRVEVKQGRRSRIGKDLVQGSVLKAPRGREHCRGERVPEVHPSWIKGTPDLHGHSIFLFSSLLEGMWGRTPRGPGLYDVPERPVLSSILPGTLG